MSIGGKMFGQEKGKLIPVSSTTTFLLRPLHCSPSNRSV